METPYPVEVRKMTVGYGGHVVLRDLTFVARQGEALVIIGPSGCGKSTVLRNMIGLSRPFDGEALYFGEDFFSSPHRERLLRRMGVLFQGGALFSDMSLAENVAFPLEELTTLSAGLIKEIVEFKLSLVGLRGAGALYPSQLSGGMRKRAALARAMALDPDILFFDEPSSGLDPISARHLDDLIIELKESLGTTLVVVTHELPSIFAIADTAVLLDADAKGIIATGDPAKLRAESDDPRVQAFLNRGDGTVAPPAA